MHSHGKPGMFCKSSATAPVNFQKFRGWRRLPEQHGQTLNIPSLESRFRCRQPDCLGSVGIWFEFLANLLHIVAYCCNVSSEVRLVVGSCFAVARGILPISELREALEAKSVVDLSEFVAPAAGTVHGHGSCALCVSLENAALVRQSASILLCVPRQTTFGRLGASRSTL